LQRLRQETTESEKRRCGNHSSDRNDAEQPGRAMMPVGIMSLGTGDVMIDPAEIVVDISAEVRIVSTKPDKHQYELAHQYRSTNYSAEHEDC
jgi:hypothetical protein